MSTETIETTEAPAVDRAKLADVARLYVAAHDAWVDAGRRRDAREFDDWYRRTDDDHPVMAAADAGVIAAGEEFTRLMEALGLSAVIVDGRVVVWVEAGRDEDDRAGLPIDESTWYVSRPAVAAL